MTDKKTSDESAASTLTGTELVRIVQSAASVKTTTQHIADLGSSVGFSGTVTTASLVGKTITVVNGIITTVA